MSHRSVSHVSNQPDKTAASDRDTVQSPINTGRLSSVVCSADCRQARPSDTTTERVPEQKQQTTDGAAGPNSVNQPSIDERFAIAVAARGDRPIGGFIYDAIWNARFITTLRDSDEEFVAALEREAFG